MSQFFPILKEKPLFFRLIVFGLLILCCLLISSIVAWLTLIPFTGDTADLLLNLKDYNDPEKLNMLKYLQIINQIGLFILPSIIFAWLYNRQSGRFLGINRKPVTRQVFLSLILLASMIPFVSFLVEWNESLHLPEFLSGLEHWMKEKENEAAKLTEAFLKNTSYGSLLVNILMIGILAAVGEELFFRGVMIRIFLDFSSNKHLSVWISSLLFSALHMQFYGFFPRMLLGLVFGYLFVWTWNLWYPIIMHFLFNSITVVVMFLHERGSIASDAESFGHYNQTWIVYGSLAVSLLLLWLFYMNRKRSNINETVN